MFCLQQKFHKLWKTWKEYETLREARDAFEKRVNYQGACGWRVVELDPVILPGLVYVPTVKDYQSLADKVFSKKC